MTIRGPTSIESSVPPTRFDDEIICIYTSLYKWARQYSPSRHPDVIANESVADQLDCDDKPLVIAPQLAQTLARGGSRLSNFESRIKQQNINK